MHPNQSHFCPNCGHPIKHESSFCPNCGIHINRSVGSSPTGDTQKTIRSNQNTPTKPLFRSIAPKWRIFITFCVVLLLIAIIIITQYPNWMVGTSTDITSTSLPYTTTNPIITTESPPQKTTIPTATELANSNTPTKNLTSTPTTFSCPGMPPSRVSVGDRVEICSLERLILRSDPDSNSTYIRAFDPGTKFEIIGGPECANSSTWWEALFVHNNKEYIGWVREGTDPKAKYFICVVR